MEVDGVKPPSRASGHNPDIQTPACLNPVNPLLTMLSLSHPL